eukprot:gene15263-20566_t
MDLIWTMCSTIILTLFAFHQKSLSVSAAMSSNQTLINELDDETLLDIQRTFATKTVEIYRNKTMLQQAIAVSGTYQHFKEGFNDSIGDAPIMMYRLWNSTNQIGNLMGFFFEALACADKAGLHFIPFFGIDARSEANPAEFVSGFHRIYRHQNPVISRIEGINNIERECKTSGWTFVYSDCTAARNVPVIKATFNYAVEAYMKNSSEWKNFVDRNNTTFDVIKRPQNGNVEILPAIPDVAILFRCSDILHGIHPAYGFLNWNIYKRLIPPHPKYIYILSEPLNYVNSSATAKICTSISIQLVDFLRKLYRSTTVGIHRGYPYQGLVVLTKARTAICAPSTFCSYPAISRTHGNVYFQTGEQLFNGTGNFSKNFHWILSPPMINFKSHKHLISKRNITGLISLLTNNRFKLITT